MRRFVLKLWMLLGILLGFYFGLAAAIAPSVLIWGPSILDTALGVPPDKSHPAFWLGLVLLVPCTLFGAVAGFMLLSLPVAFRHPAIFGSMKIDSEDRIFGKPLKWYGRNVLDYASRLQQEPEKNRALDA